MRSWVHVAAALLVAGCATVRPKATRALEFELPSGLSAERAAYATEIDAAVEAVTSWFRAEGLPVAADDLVTRAVVFTDVAAARQGLSQALGVAVDQIPPSFSGTVDGKTLFLVSRPTYEATYRALYPDHPWSPDEYRRLVIHEVAHRAHALVATRVTGSEEGMGPTWFFEGLAMTCAGQFTDGSPLDWDEVEKLVADDRRKALSYPRYAQMVRAAAARRPIRWLVEHAAREDFLEQLRAVRPQEHGARDDVAPTRPHEAIELHFHRGGVEPVRTDDRRAAHRPNQLISAASVYATNPARPCESLSCAGSFAAQ